MHTLWITYFVILWLSEVTKANLLFCHYDPEPSPKNGVLRRDLFTWMAVLEYLHLGNGSRYGPRVPRVSIVHPQFAITTAAVATDVPEGYSLGNVVIVEYVRDEQTCGLTIEDYQNGVKCPRSSYVMPIADVLVHPEYVNFGAPDSVALLQLMRPIESTYLMPVCLPLESAWDVDMRVKKARLFDFVSAAPADYESEIKASKRLHILPTRDCESYQERENISRTWWARTLCTTGCGMRAGAPLAAHDSVGRTGLYWHLVGIAVGGPPCTRYGDQDRRNAEPPRFVDIWPYTEWISQVIMTHVRPFPLPSARLLRSDKETPRKWEGRWYMYGKRCVPNSYYPTDRFYFYRDKFVVKSLKKAHLRYVLHLETPLTYVIRCVKVHLPNQFLTPKVVLNQYNSSVTIPSVSFPRRYELAIQAWCEQAGESYVIDFKAEIKKFKDMLLTQENEKLSQ